MAIRPIPIHAKALAKFLISQGIPEDSIVISPPDISMGSISFSADLALIDTQSKNIVAVFKFFDASASYTKELVRELLRSYIKSAGLTYSKPILTKTIDLDNFQFFDASSDSMTEIQIEALSNIKALSTFQDATKLNKAIENKKEVSNKLQILSYLMSVIALALVVADFILKQYNFTLLTTERLYILAAIPILIFLPALQKIKIFDIEFEQTSKKTDNNTSTHDK